MLKHMLVLIVCVGVPVVVWAASELSLFAQLRGERGVDLLINLLAACAAAMANVAFRLKSGPMVNRLGKELLISVLIGVLAGAVMFFLTEVHVNNFYQLGLVIVAGWAGGRIIEALSAKVIDKINQK